MSYYLAAMRLHDKRKPTPKWKDITLAMLALSSGIIIVQFLQRGSFSALAIFIFLFLLWPLLKIFTLVVRRNIFKKGQPPGKVTYRFAEDGFHSSHPQTGESRVPWNNFRNVIQDDQTVLMYMMNGSFLYLPKCALSEEQLSGVDAILCQRVTGKV